MNDSPENENGTLAWLSAIGIELWKHREKLRQYFFPPKSSRNSKGILVLGPGGTGKSTLGGLLASSFRSTANSAEYLESISTEQFLLTDDLDTQILVLPGQEHRQDSTWTTILDEVKQNKYCGVILVQAFGHHTLGDFSYKNHRCYKNGESVDDFLHNYFEACRESERKVLHKICSAIEKCTEPIWIMTLVTKQDLWDDQTDHVAQYYNSGDYAEIFTKCLGIKEPHQFRHETALVSLIIRNLMTGRGECLKETAAGYDQLKQQASLSKMMKMFESLMKWGKENGQR